MQAVNNKLSATRNKDASTTEQTTLKARSKMKAAKNDGHEAISKIQIAARKQQSTRSKKQVAKQHDANIKRQTARSQMLKR